MSKLLTHFRAMQSAATEYVADHKTPGPQLDRSFALQMVEALDGPEQREAQADAEFDYVAESDVTASGMDGRVNVNVRDFANALRDFVEAANNLDDFKKLLFRGRDPSEFGLPKPEVQHSLAGFIGLAELDLLHGVVGVATESGELAEVILALVTTRTPWSFEGDADVTNVREEIGDNLWYLARLVKWSRTTFDAEMRRNIGKLRKRHTATGFDKDRDKDRDHGAERAVLEADEPAWDTPAGQDARAASLAPPYALDERRPPVGIPNSVSQSFLVDGDGKVLGDGEGQ